MSILISHAFWFKAFAKDQLDKPGIDVEQIFSEICDRLYESYGADLIKGQTIISLSKILSNLCRRTVFLTKEDKKTKSVISFKKLIARYFLLDTYLPYKIMDIIKIPTLTDEFTAVAQSLATSPAGSILSICAGPGTGKTKFIVDFLRICAARSNCPNVLITGYARSTVNTIKHRMASTIELSKSYTDSFTSTTKPIKIMSIDSMIAKMIPHNLRDRSFDQKIVAMIDGMRTNSHICSHLSKNSITFIIVDEAQSVDDLRMNFLLRLHFKYRNSVLLLIGDPKQNVNGNRCTVSNQAFSGSLAGNTYLVGAGYTPESIQINSSFISMSYRFLSSWSIKVANFAAKKFFNAPELTSANIIGTVDNKNKEYLATKFKFNTVYDLAEFDGVIKTCIELTKNGISVGLMFPSVTKDQIYTKELLSLIKQAHAADVCISFKNDTQFRVAGMNISTYASSPGTEFDVAYAVCPEDAFTNELRFVALSRGKFFTHLVVNKMPNWLDGQVTMVDRETKAVSKVENPMFYGRTIRPVVREILYDKEEFSLFNLHGEFFVNNFHPEVSKRTSMPSTVSAWRFNKLFGEEEYTITHEEYVQATGIADLTTENEKLYSALKKKFSSMTKIVGMKVETSLHTFICPAHFYDGERYYIAYHDNLLGLVGVLASHPELSNLMVTVINAESTTFNITTETKTQFDALFDSYCNLDYCLGLYPVPISKQRRTFVVGYESTMTDRYEKSYNNVVLMNRHNPYDTYIVDSEKTENSTIINDDMYDDEDVIGMTDFAVETNEVHGTKNTIYQFMEGLDQLTYFVQSEAARKYFANIIPNTNEVVTQGIDIWPYVVEKALIDGYSLSASLDKINLSELYTQVISPRVSDQSSIMMAAMLVQLIIRYRID